MLCFLLDSMEDKSLNESLKTMAEIFRRRILDSERNCARTKGEDSGLYRAEDYRDCLDALVILESRMSDAMVDLTGAEELSEFREALDERVEKMKARILAKQALDNNTVSG